MNIMSTSFWLVSILSKRCMYIGWNASLISFPKLMIYRPKFQDHPSKNFDLIDNNNWAYQKSIDHVGCCVLKLITFARIQGSKKFTTGQSWYSADENWQEHVVWWGGGRTGGQGGGRTGGQGDGGGGGLVGGQGDGHGGGCAILIFSRQELARRSGLMEQLLRAKQTVWDQKMQFGDGAGSWEKLRFGDRGEQRKLKWDAARKGEREREIGKSLCLRSDRSDFKKNRDQDNLVCSDLA